jgi:uncharacterized protein (DUF362 family)
MAKAYCHPHGGRSTILLERINFVKKVGGAMLKIQTRGLYFAVSTIIMFALMTGCAKIGTTASSTSATQMLTSASSETSAQTTTPPTASATTAVNATQATSSQTEPEPIGPVVGLAKGKDYQAVTSQAIANAGGLATIVSAGDTVLIKPNLCWNKYVDSPITTDYRVVAEIVSEVKALGAGRIIIAEGPFGPECFTQTNLTLSKYDTIQGVDFISFNAFAKDDCYYLQGLPSVTGKALYIPKVYVDADVVITVPKMKTHNNGMVTLGLKNAFGVPPRSIYGTSKTTGSKIRLHNDFDFTEAIVEINLIRKPDFVVIDGIVAGEGEGPLNNSVVDAQLILAGSDIVAVDTVGAALMGFDPLKIPHIALAGQSGLGEGDLNKITVIGGSVEDLAIDFKSIFPKG